MPHDLEQFVPPGDYRAIEFIQAYFAVAANAGVNLLSNNSVTYLTVRPSSYGAAGPTATAAQNRGAIQSAIDTVNAAGGGCVLIDGGGDWLVNDAPTLSPRRCITLAANVFILIAPGTTLKQGNNTTSNANPTTIFYQPASATNCFVGWPYGKGGTIDGNTANQAAWTGGYGQTNGNHHILSQDGMDGLCVQGLTLTNCFSNPINVGTSNAYGLSQNVRLQHLLAKNFGEGIQLISVDNIFLVDVAHLMSSNWNGDGLELAFCRRGNMYGIDSRTDDGAVRVSGGSGVDFYASRDCTLDGFLFEGIVYPFQIECDFSTPSNYPDNISISNGTVKSSYAWLVQSGGRASYNNIRFLNQLGGGPQIRNDYPSAVCRAAFTGCHWPDNVGGGISIGANTTLRLAGCSIHIASGAPSGIISASGACVLDIDGLRASSAVVCPLLFVAASAVPTGRLTNVHAPGVASAITEVVSIGAGANVSDLVVTGTPPLVGGGAGVAHVVGAGVVETGVTVTSANLPAGTKDQRLTFLGTYGPTFTAGARLKIEAAVASFTIPTSAHNRLTLQYDTATDVWREIDRLITSVAMTGVMIFNGSFSDPAASATSILASLIGRVGSLKSIGVQSTPNGIAGSATVKVFEWGTEKGSHTINGGNQYGGESTFIPNQVALSALGNLEIKVVTDASWTGSGNLFRVRVETWQQ